MALQEWLEEVYRDHAAALFRFVLHLTGDENETREVLQEVFIRLAKEPRLLDKVDAPRPYLFRMAHRLVIDRHRRETARRKYDERAQQEHDLSAGPEPSPNDEAWTRRLLASSLDALPAQQKAVVVLKVWEEMTFAEIAEVLDIPANTAASRYRYALDKLRDDLRPLQRELP